MIWSAIKGIFGSSRSLDSIDNTIDHIAKGIDTFTFTEQEKSEARVKGLDYHLKFVEATNNQNSGQSKARRTMAKTWVYTYLSLVGGYLLTVGLSIKWVGLAVLALAFKDMLILLGTGTLMILGFYYGVHLARSFVKK